jgi:hypothetical protein
VSRALTGSSDRARRISASGGGGAAALESALADHDGSVLGDPSEILAGGGSGAGILGHVLGAKQLEVAQHIAGSSGLDLGSVAKLLPMLAPMVMGYLGRKQRADGLDAGGLAEMLGGEKKSLEGAGPGLGGLSKILGGDGDGDGDMMDDIKGMAGGLLGKLSGRK